MSRIRDLEHQMSELQGELAKLQRESRERDQRYQQEYQLRMQELKHTMKNAMERHNTQQAQQIQRQMDALNTELMNRIQRNHDALKNELTRNLEIRHRDLMNQIQQYYLEVQNRIDHEIVNVMDESEAQKKRLAQQEYQAAVAQYQLLTSRAHEELFPGKLLIYNGTMEQAHRMMAEQRQYEASAATSVMLKVNLKDFDYQINDKLAEWLRSYLRMEQSYVRQADRIENDLLMIDGENLSEDTVMEWTGHRYDEIFKCLHQVKEIIEEVELHQRMVREDVVSAATVEDYIRMGEKPKSRELDEHSRVLLYELPGKLDEMKKELVSAYRCSAQRKVWAEKLREYFSKKHNTGNPCYDGFSDDEEGQGERSRYRLEVERPNGNGRANRYVIHIVPVLVNGEVENHIRMFMNFKTGGTTYQKQQEMKYVRAILQVIGEKRVYIGIGTDEDVLTGSGDAEYSLQPAANGRGEQLVLHSRQQAGNGTNHVPSGGNEGDHAGGRQGSGVRRRRSEYETV